MASEAAQPSLHLYSSQLSAFEQALDTAGGNIPSTEMSPHANAHTVSADSSNSIEDVMGQKIDINAVLEDFTKSSALTPEQCIAKLDKLGNTLVRIVAFNQQQLNMLHVCMQLQVSREQTNEAKAPPTGRKRKSDESEPPAKRQKAAGEIANPNGEQVAPSNLPAVLEEFPEDDGALFENSNACVSAPRSEASRPGSRNPPDQTTAQDHIDAYNQSVSHHSSKGETPQKDNSSDISLLSPRADSTSDVIQVVDRSPSPPLSDEATIAKFWGSDIFERQFADQSGEFFRAAASCAKQIQSFSEACKYINSAQLTRLDSGRKNRKHSSSKAWVAEDFATATELFNSAFEPPEEGDNLLKAIGFGLCPDKDGVLRPGESRAAARSVRSKNKAVAAGAQEALSSKRRTRRTVSSSESSYAEDSDASPEPKAKKGRKAGAGKTKKRTRAQHQRARR